MRVVGVALLVGGLVLLAFGYNASQAPLESASETLTGKFTDSTMLYFILGAIGVVVGGIMAVARRGL